MSRTSSNLSIGPSLGVVGRIVIVVLVALLFLTIFVSGATVQAGYVGVLLTFGRVNSGVLEPGFHLIIPLAQRIVQVDTRVLPHAFKEIEAASREYQTVRLTGTMNYHLEAQQAPDLYQTVGLDFADKVIDPAFNDFIKEVVPRYQATEILVRRDEIRTTARTMLGQNLSRYGIVVDDIYVSNISFSKDYQDAIERKQTAQQNVETEQQILAQKEIQAQQAVVEARGKAEARVTSADGDARSNERLTASISPQLIEYLRWTRWDGKLPLFSGSQSPFVSVPLDRLSGGDDSAAAAQPTAAVAGPTPQQPAPTPGRTPTP
ncbi:MAG TPA: prohibitin family protein [Chloroflexota bacterium]|nr:prohibitin family protein [Chloroflexota bacterium]